MKMIFIFFGEDMHFYNYITIREGMFIMFFPGEIHKPECRADLVNNVKKFIFKVKY